MKKAVKITTFKKQLQDDAEFWANKSYEERLSAVELFRIQKHGAALLKQPMQKVVRIYKLAHRNKK